MTAAFELRSLRDGPYELLRELDRRARGAAQGRPEAAVSGAEWVGIAFRLGGEAFLLAREETREVMSYPAAVTRAVAARIRLARSPRTGCQRTFCTISVWATRRPLTMRTPRTGSM